MRVLFINEVCGHSSTGKICAELAEEYFAKGHEVKIAYGRDNYVPEKYQKYAIRIGTDWDVKLHAVLTRITDKHGLGSRKATQNFLKWAEKYNPDLVWLHNLHGYYINYELLFDWIKSKPALEVKWTLHDCWAFTGHCAYFTIANCEKWKTHCSHCLQKNKYPSSILLDNCYSNYERKKAAFTGVSDLTIYTPSQWLKDLVKESFLQAYKVNVLYNSIDVNIFKPTPSDFRRKYCLEDKKIVLGVASTWDYRKGLGDFIKLHHVLNSNYTIVLVGLSKDQVEKLPNGIIGIEKTFDQKELASIYSAADVFISPSREETFGMTVLEALCCGTKVIVYKDTACEEVINKWGNGNALAVEYGIDNLFNAVKHLSDN